MTISEFARYTGIKRDNLIFYDKIGMISPEFRGENGYRYYTQRQLSTAFLISSLRELGIGIETIKGYTEKRTPLKMLELFKEQERKIDAEIQTLKRLKDMMKLYTDITSDVLQEDITSIQIKQQGCEPLFLGPRLHFQEEQFFLDKSMIEFYDYAAECGMALSYPLGIIFSKENLLERKLGSPQRFYFKMPKSHHQFKPVGRYVVGYMQGEYSQVENLYGRILDFIEANGLVICGDAYEEYPLSEISVRNEEEYLIKVEIMVE